MENKEKSEAVEAQTKKIRSIASNKRELEINGKLVSILPNQVIEVPADFVVPTGFGLQKV